MHVICTALSVFLFPLPSFEINCHELIDSPLGSSAIWMYNSTSVWLGDYHREFTEPFLSAGGVTSGWFCLESSLLTLAISAAAFAFYRDRTKQKARRMFHASLLYLPVFMSGLIVHRVTDNQQGLVQDNSEKTVELSSSSGTLEQENENVRSQNKAGWPAAGSPAKSPVAYASVAPFPFLPAPIYSADWSLYMQLSLISVYAIKFMYNKD